MFKQSDKVYFHRGPVELIGVVLTASQGSVTLLGVELGFRSPSRERITISELDYLCAMDDETFDRLSKDEPAFAKQRNDAHLAPASQRLAAIG